MNSQSESTRRRLYQAAVQLADEQGLDRVSVAALTRIAERSRDTFYRYASTPTELVTQGLSAELAENMTVFRELLSSDAPGYEVFTFTSIAVLEHVDAHRSLYRGGDGRLSSGPLRELLRSFAVEVLGEYFDTRRPLPPWSGDTVSQRERDHAVAYASSGFIGCVELWYRSDSDSIADTVTQILAVVPEWWVTEQA